jgi:aryl-alcohol dehydrogenase-like predicted oxidoreductase
MEQLEVRTLGRTGLEVTRLGAGGHFTNGPLAHEDVPRRVRELNHLLNLGVTYFDVQWDKEELATAEVMRSRGNEFTVAWPLHGMNQRDPAQVRQYVIDYCRDHRQRYGIQHVDILLWVGLEFGDGHGAERIRGATEGFNALKAEGFCDHFGFSCHHSPQSALRAITEFDVFGVMMVPYSPLHPAAGRQLLPSARAHGVGAVAMKPFGGGDGFLNMVWAGKISHPSVAHLKNDSRPYEAALRWVLKDPNVDCTVPAAHSIQQIDELHNAVKAEGRGDGELLAQMLAAMNESGADVQLRGGLAARPDAWD